MRFALAVLAPGATAPVSVDVDAQPSTTVGLLADSLMDELGVDPDEHGGEAPAVHVGPREVAPELTLAEAGVGNGTTVGLGRPAPTETGSDGMVEVRVVGGTGAGVTYRLVPGSYDIGGAAASLVRVDGPDLVATMTVTSTGEVRLAAHADGIDVAGHDLGAGEEVAWPTGGLVSVGGLLLEVADVAIRSASVTTSDDVVGKQFNRPPRSMHVPSPLRLRLPRQVPEPTRSAVPLLPLVLLPLVGSVVIVLVTGNLRFIVFGLLSPIAALLSRSGNAKSQRRQHEKKVEEHDQTLARLEADLEEALASEQLVRRRGHPDPATLLSIAALPTDRLWERRRSDPDFLSLRLGTGTVASMVTVEDPNQDEHRRVSTPVLREVPVTVDLSATGVLGVAGDPSAVRWLIAELCVLHSPLDLDLCVLAGETGAPDWEWTRWLPHVRRASGSLALGTSTDSVARRIAELVQVVEARTAAVSNRASVEDQTPLVVVMNGARRLRSLPGVVTLLREGPGVGVFVVCLDTDEERLPEECAAVLVASPDGSGTLKLADASTRTVRRDVPEPGWYDLVGRSLAPLDAIGQDDGAALPDSVRLVHLLGLDYTTIAEDVAGRWVLAPRSTVSRLGVGLDGPFDLDLVTDGPHGLVAGTTGSGKSELLQSLVASLAVANRPDELNFVLVDYKGGSAFAECEFLPHTVGMVTDLDTTLVERALTSLNAELRTREHLLADTGAKDIADYIDRRSADPSLAPLPRLVIVIDEFASMVRELPDFVTGLVNLAQRGRSLGIHLILATQRPSGAVSSDIRANTNLRIALRTTDANESRDIIDAPDSAELSPARPGRAFARLNASVLLPFQAARVGGRRAGQAPTGPAVPAAVAAQRLTWTELGADTTVLARAAATTASTALAPVTQDLTTDMAVLADALVQAADRLEIAPPRRPWLPPLPERFDLALGEDLPEPEVGDVGRGAVWGLVDDPERQEQRPLVLDLATAGHLHVIGATQSGRSQALRSLAAALASATSASDLHLYAIDCGAGALRTLESFPHTGAVVDHRSPERLARVLDRLGDELESRQRALGQRGAADLEELRRELPADERPPHIVLLVDRFEVFHRDFTTFDNGSYLDRLSALLRDGAAAGLHVVLAGDRTLASSRYAGTTDDKLVLRQNDSSDWSSLGVRTKDVPEHLAEGRALRPGTKLTVQVGVLPTPGTAEVTGSAQSQALEKLAAAVTARDLALPESRLPRPLLEVPQRISLSETLAVVEPLPVGRAVVGVGGDDLSIMGPNLVETPTFVVAGPPRSGRSTALMTMVVSMLRTGEVGVVVIAPRRSPLRDLAGHPAVAAVLTDGETVAEQLRAALQEVPQRLGVVVIDDGELVLASDATQDLSAIARGAAGEGWAVLAAGNAEAFVSALGGWLAPMRRNRQGLLLSPQSRNEGELIGAQVTRGSLGGRPVPGRGLLHLGDGQVVTVQVPDGDASLATAVTAPTDPNGRSSE